MFILFNVHGGVVVHLTLIYVVEFRNGPKPSLRVINTKYVTQNVLFQYEAPLGPNII